LHASASRAASFAWKPIQPWCVARVWLQDGQSSVIVKWVRDDARDLRTDLAQAASEQAALTFLADLGFAGAPNVLAADGEAGLLILEDLAPRTPLAARLREEGPAACMTALTAFARITADLHAATAGRAAQFDDFRARFGAPAGLAPWEPVYRQRWAQMQAFLESLGFVMPVEAVAEHEAAARQILDAPGPFHVLSNGDPQVNNLLWDGADARLIDFEFAAYRHAGTALTWIHMPGSAWLTVSHPGAADLEAEYRRAVAAAIPQAADDHLFGEGLTGACLIEALERLTRFAILDARAAGDASRLQMISTLEAAAGVSRRHGALRRLGDWCQEAAGWLRNRWPEADIDLAGIRPYTQRG
jgi:hypothetical protein